MIYRIAAVLFFILAANQAYSQSQTVGIFLNDSMAYNGYTLFAPINYNHVYLINNCGYKVNEWECGQRRNHMAYLLDDGSLIRTGVVPSFDFQGGGVCGIVDCYSWDGDLLWDFEYHSSQHHQHHDIEPLPNGNFLMIVWYKYSEEEAIAAGKNPQMLDNELWMDHIMEVDPSDGEIVWEWNAMDHLIQDYDASKENYGVVADHPEKIDINYTDDNGPGGRVDWMHTNSIDYHAEFDQILLSVRQYSEVWILDHSTTTEEAAGSSGGTYGKGGDLLYRWGNPEAYGRGDADDQILRHMHDPLWIPDEYIGGGSILVFNNDHGINQSAVIEFNPPEDNPGFYTDPGSDAYGPASYDWIYEGQGLFSRSISGSQRLPNGNTLICEGQGGNFTEVTYEEKSLVWRYRSPVSMFGPLSQGDPPEDISQFKIRRYGPGFQGFEGKELMPGEPVELDPWVYDCTIYEDTTYTSSDISVLSVNIRAINPFGDKLKIFADAHQNIKIRIFNIHGEIMKTVVLESKETIIDTGNWPAGLYMLNVLRFNQIAGNIKIIKSSQNY